VTLESGELAEVRLDIETNGGPLEMVVGRPLLELSDSLGGGGRIAGVYIEALFRGKHEPGGDRNAGLSQLLDDGGSLGRKVSDFDGDPGVELDESGENGGIGEELLHWDDAFVAAGKSDVGLRAGAGDFD
jgi:hypothetical protein